MLFRSDRKQTQAGKMNQRQKTQVVSRRLTTSNEATNQSAASQTWAVSRPRAVPKEFAPAADCTRTQSRFIRPRPAPIIGPAKSSWKSTFLLKELFHKYASELVAVTVFWTIRR